MKKSILFLTSLLFTCCVVQSQTFEGKIVYQNNIKSKLPNVTDAQFAAMMGNTMEYYIKNGDYKTISNGSLLQSQNYINAENKLYTKMSNSATFMWNDGAVNPDEVLKVEINKAVTTVAGHSCDEVILTCKSGIQKYYYNAKIGVDADKFVNHKFGNWHAFVSQSKALPLKYIIENPQFSMEVTATSVENIVLEPSFFALPANAKTAKNPY